MLPSANIAARASVPVAASGVVTRSVHRALPPAALVATMPMGGVNFQAIMRSLIRHPKQVPTLFCLALDSWAARQSLVPSRHFLGPNLGVPDMRQHLLDVA